VREEEEEEEGEFIQNRTRAGARFLTRWDQHAVAQRGSDGPVADRNRAGLFGNLGEIPDEGGRGPECHAGVTQSRLHSR